MVRNHIMWLNEDEIPDEGFGVRWFPEDSKVTNYWGCNGARVIQPDGEPMIDITGHFISKEQQSVTKAAVDIVWDFLDVLYRAHEVTVGKYRETFGADPEHVTLFVGMDFKAGHPNSFEEQFKGEGWMAGLRYGFTASNRSPVYQYANSWFSFCRPFGFQYWGSRREEILLEQPEQVEGGEFIRQALAHHCGTFIGWDRPFEPYAVGPT